MVLYINSSEGLKSILSNVSLAKEYNFVESGLKIGNDPDSAKFSIQSGIAYFYTNGTQSKINVAQRSLSLPDILQNSTVAYVFLKSNGTIFYQTASPQSWDLVDKIALGAITSTDVGRTLSQVYPFIINSDPNSMATLDYGIQNITADTVKLQGIENTLRLKIGSGKIRNAGRNYFNNKSLPHLTTFPVQNPITFRYVNRDGSIESVTDTLDTIRYERNGELRLVRDGRCSIQYVFISASGSIAIQRGQTLYGSIDDTSRQLSGDIFIKAPNLSGFVLIAAIGLKKGATNILTLADAKIYTANKDGAIG